MIFGGRCGVCRMFFRTVRVRAVVRMVCRGGTGMAGGKR